MFPIIAGYTLDMRRQGKDWCAVGVKWDHEASAHVRVIPRRQRYDLVTEILSNGLR